MQNYLALAVVSVALLACSTLGSQQTKTTTVAVFQAACSGFDVALEGAAVALTANRLTEAQITAIDGYKVEGKAICKGPIPSDYGAAAINVIQLTSEISSTTKGGGA